MRHRRRRGKLGVTTNHRKALLRNLVRNLVLHKRIKTTVAKAHALSSFADRMISLAKRADLHSRRLLIAKLGSASVTKTLISEIAPHFKNRRGGYTRVLRLGVRPGDGAQTALVEFTETIEAPRKEKKPKKVKKEKLPKQEEAVPEKVKEGKPKEKEVPAKKPPVEKEEKPGKKETEKRGGFLSTLRKFLKGDDK